MIQTQENVKKLHFEPNSGPLGPNLGCQIFFLKNLALSVTRYHGQLLSCTIPEKTKKTNVPILRIFSDGWTDGQRAESDLIGCCWTNGKCPI